jgi:hypothetical protein
MVSSDNGTVSSSALRRNNSRPIQAISNGYSLSFSDRIRPQAMPGPHPAVAHDGVLKWLFSLVLWKGTSVTAARMNRMPAKNDSVESRNLRDRCALSLPLQGMAVMDRGDIVAGSKSTRKPQANPQGVIVDNRPSPADAATGRSESASGNAEQHCGAMSQQRCNSGATSTPQQFVHLVGCRDPKAGQHR